MNATASSIARGCSSNGGAPQRSNPSGESAAAALEALRASMLGCCKCAALVRCRSRVVPGHGAAPASVMFVGIAPGRFGGDRSGIPFSGDRSGNLLRAMIAQVGLANVFISNLVRCNPRDARGRNRDPSAREIANCREHLAAEIAIVRPRVIVCLGRMAWREIAGRDAPFDPHKPIVRERAGMIVYPMYHPGYVIRGAYSERRYTRDFARLRELMTGAEFLPPQSFAWQGIPESSALIVARSNRHAHRLRRRIAH